MLPHYRIASIYLIVGSMWVVFSDSLVRKFSETRDIAQLIQTTKGWLFILATSLLLFLLVKQQFQNLNNEQNRLKESESKFRLLAENAKDLIFRFEFLPKPHYSYVSPAASTVTGFNPSEFYDNSRLFFNQLHPEDRKLVSKFSIDSFDQTQTLRFFRKDKQMIWIGQANVAIYDDHQSLIAVESISRDITQQKEINDQLKYLAQHDTLTGLFNRWFLQKSIQSSLAESSYHVLLLLDLDGFTLINEALGHSKGDLLLKQFADRLRELFNQSAIIGRLGGDEFAIWFANHQNIDSDHYAKLIINSMNKPFLLEKNIPIYLGVSIGISESSASQRQSSELMQQAEVALTQTKTEGKNNYRHYQPGMLQTRHKRLELGALLRTAIDNSEISVQYQPLVSMKTNRIYGVEALLRWHSSAYKQIPPDVFIPIAEETGLIMELGDFALVTACKAMQHLLSLGYDLKTIAVNVSPKQFILYDLVASVTDALQKSNLPAKYLELEITESAIMQDPQQTLQILHKLCDLDIRLAIDDFGTGYSSLSHLQKFPLHKLKIDRSFVQHLPESSGSATIVSTIIGMAKGLNLQVLAEGVENELQRHFLIQSGCDFYQGYYCSPPVSIDSLIQLLDNEKNA